MEGHLDSVDEELHRFQDLVRRLESVDQSLTLMDATTIVEDLCSAIQHTSSQVRDLANAALDHLENNYRGVIRQLAKRHLLLSTPMCQGMQPPVPEAQLKKITEPAEEYWALKICGEKFEPKVSDTSPPLQTLAELVLAAATRLVNETIVLVQGLLDRDRLLHEIFRTYMGRLRNYANDSTQTDDIRQRANQLHGLCMSILRLQSNVFNPLRVINDRGPKSAQGKEAQQELARLSKESKQVLRELKSLTVSGRERHSWFRFFGKLGSDTRLVKLN